MDHQFEWLRVEPAYREARSGKHGEELRWLVNQETILNHGTGKTVTRGTIRHPGICVIAPFADASRILLMKQYRYAANETLWELPAGTLSGREGDNRMESTESPEECAHRELREETGYQAARMEKIAECYAMPGMSDERMHLFFARDLTWVGQDLDLGEVIEEIRPFTRDELDGMIRNGEIRDAKTLVGLFYALRQE